MATSVTQSPQSIIVYAPGKSNALDSAIANQAASVAKQTALNNIVGGYRKGKYKRSKINSRNKKSRKITTRRTTRTTRTTRTRRSTRTKKSKKSKSKKGRKSKSRIYRGGLAYSSVVMNTGVSQYPSPPTIPDSSINALQYKSAATQAYIAQSNALVTQPSDPKYQSIPLTVTKN